MPTDIFLIRHADARDGNIRHTKKTPLTPDRGRKQTLDLVSYFKKNRYYFDILVTSFAVRARETSDILAVELNLFPNPLEILGEIKRSVDGLPYDGPTNELYIKGRQKAFNDLNIYWKFHEKDESFWELFKRSTQIKHELLREFEGQKVAVVSHSQPELMITLSMLAGDKPTPRQIFGAYRQYFLKPAHFSHLRHTPNHGWQLISFNLPE